MEPILILYASQTGVTQDIAGTLRDRLIKEMPDQPFDLESVRDLQVSQLANYRQVIFGNSTWDHGIPSPDGEEFLERLVTEKPDLSTVSFGLFGTGDTAYPAFCEALPLVESDLKSCQAKIHPEQFTIDGYPDAEVFEGLTDWAKSFLDATK